ncbi:unnamed protein product [Mesocestoides corti]|uniref:EGF-like domain-containing protein n=1 Tax=Mesocestoides corti TaxID=53468 RepID=A0A0R3U2Z5_MESCO|nr:unnamed protein product [Mesocestoides corti]
MPTKAVPSIGYFGLHFELDPVAGIRHISNLGLKEQLRGRMIEFITVMAPIAYVMARHCACPTPQTGDRNGPATDSRGAPPEHTPRVYSGGPFTGKTRRPIEERLSIENTRAILQFQFAYTCLADYFGDLCNVFCSSEAKEYRCSLTGEKICNPGYIKDNVTGACIYDRCGSMPNYCLNGGQCINKAQDEEGAMDSTTMPICICPPSRMGVRCEIYREVPPTTPQPPPPPVSSKTQMSNPTNNVSILQPSADEVLDSRPSGALGQPGPDNKLWYQVMIFAAVAVCLTVLAFGICLGAGCYVVRMKAKAALLRRHQESRLGEMQFVDGGCLSTSESGGGIPVYLQRCSSLDYTPQTLQRPPSVRSFALSRPATSSGLITDTVQTPTDQPFVFSKGFGRTGDSLVWPTLRRTAGKTWGEYGFETFTRCPTTTSAGDIDLGLHEDGLPTINPMEAYSCRHDPYGFLSELHNHLGDPLTSSAPLMNNMLPLQTSTILSPTRQQGTKSPISVEGGRMDLRKNNFQMAAAPPPSEFADLVMK